MTTIVSPASVAPRSRRVLPHSVAFVTVSAALAAFFLAAGAPTPLLPIYEERWHFAPWLLTVAFGVYALALLAALLVFGSLSDLVGRRPLLISALGLELVAMLVFLEARSIGWVIAGRIVQGIATGAATSAFSAAIVELAPEHRKGLGATISSVAPAAGLGVGAVLAGGVAQFSTAAPTTVWASLTAVMALGTLLALFVPETSSRRPGALASLAPHAGVPAHARGDFIVAVPAQIAAWMMAALFFGLVPTVLGAVFDRHSPLESGVTACVVPATFTLATVFLSKVTPQRLMVLGGVSVVVGAVLVSASAALALLPLLWLGGVASGIGFGATLTGTIRLLTPQVDTHERAELFAAIYVVAYLAFGLPAIVAGLFVTSMGVPAVVVTFGIVTATVAALGLGGQVLHAQRGRTSMTEARPETPVGSGVLLVRVFGQPMDPAGYVLRDFLSRTVAHYTWTELTNDDDCVEALGVPLGHVRLPVVNLPGGERLEAPNPVELAQRLGWVAQPSADVYDLSIYGAGPAGLSAAVYAASEGLRVAVIERDAVGGQAGSSSLIENYLGFPAGISGAELAERARQQAVKFGAELLQMRAGQQGRFSEGMLRVNLSDGSVLASRSNICATGVRWRRLGLEDEERFFGAGLYYGSGIGEAPQCSGEQIVVVGGANSAGQAAMHLSEYADKVTLLVRGAALSRKMSAYLVDRIAAEPTVDVRTGTRITRLIGDRTISGIEARNTEGADVEIPATRVFVCIGGTADTEWAEGTELVRDQDGLFLTGNDLSSEMLDGIWPLDRRPFDLETSVPGFFAIGDVRQGSIKRVASAVGEGALAVSFVHRFLAEA